MPAKVFEHFEIPPDATGTVKAKCRHCASVISGRVETTSNFISHLKAPKIDDDFFSFMGSDSSTQAPVSTGFETELKEYLTQPCASEKSDPLLYWKYEESKYPVLSVLARRYLAIPASSAPVERLFSIAGKIFRPERCSMKDETFERLMMIKCNSKLPKPVSGESVSTSQTV